MEKRLAQEPADCLKVVAFGPESTGKSTLCKDLALYYETLWVPEYARYYLQNKWNLFQKTCEEQDLLPIAEGQIKAENELSKKVDKLLICDTDLMVTKVYSESYYDGYCHPEIDFYAKNNTYDLYFLTHIDVPWEADDLRDRPHLREEMFENFKQALKNFNRPFVELKGNREQRRHKAISHINLLIS